MKQEVYDLKSYDFGVPKSLIAQEPAKPRHTSRLLAVNRKNSSIEEDVFSNIVDYLREGDLLVLNNTKVIKARIIGNKQGAGKVEILLLKKIKKGVWEVLVKPGKRARLNDTIVFDYKGLKAKVIGITAQAARVLEFDPSNLEGFINYAGKAPLPPYIKKEVDDPDDYQTVYAKKEGAVAAPTAGLHFTRELIKKVRDKGVKIVFVTLHCSLATFRPVKTQDIREHDIESEWVEVTPSCAKAVNEAKKSGRRVVAVGTTSVRSLESAAFLKKEGLFLVKPFSKETNLYITPGYKFKIVDAIITNFHTPASTNLILASCFCGLSLLKQSYNRAIALNFRFYSFGDAMLIA